MDQRATTVSPLEVNRHVIPAKPGAVSGIGGERCRGILASCGTCANLIAGEEGQADQPGSTKPTLTARSWSRKIAMAVRMRLCLSAVLDLLRSTLAAAIGGQGSGWSATPDLLRPIGKKQGMEMVFWLERNS